MLKKSKIHRIMCKKDHYQWVKTKKSLVYLKMNWVKEFIGLRPKCYAYLTDDDSIDKRAKGTKKCVIII